MIAAANEHDIPFGTIVSVGNALHLGIQDYLRALGDDPGCGAVCVYLESVADIYAFADVATGVAAKKPVVALIGGRTEPGKAAAFEHTGATAMGKAEAANFCEQAGLIQVTSLRRAAARRQGVRLSTRGHRTADTDPLQLRRAWRSGGRPVV